MPPSPAGARRLPKALGEYSPPSPSRGVRSSPRAGCPRRDEDREETRRCARTSSEWLSSHFRDREGLVLATHTKALSVGFISVVPTRGGQGPTLGIPATSAHPRNAIRTVGGIFRERTADSAGK